MARGEHRVRRGGRLVPAPPLRVRTARAPARGGSAPCPGRVAGACRESAQLRRARSPIVRIEVDAASNRNILGFYEKAIVFRK